MSTPIPLDPITFEVIRNQLEHICRQMSIILRRTSYSPILYDMVDFSNALFNTNGDLVGQAENCPVHLGAMHFSTKAALAEVGVANLVDGDVLVLNDPFRGGTHVPDMTFITPIFHLGALAGFAASRGHWTDLGGAAAGVAAASRHVVEDGLVIGPAKIYEAGRPVTAVIDLIRANTRVPQYVDGDLRAHLGALLAGKKGVQELLTRYGREVYDLALVRLIDYVEQRTRAAIARIPNGTYQAQHQVDYDGVLDRPVGLQVTLEVKDQDISIDFSGSDPLTRGPLNSPMANTFAACYFALKFFLDPGCPTNAGFYRPLDIKLPADSWVNARWPASTRLCTTAAAEAICEVIWQALRQTLPQSVNAANYGANAHYLAGRDLESGGYFVFGDLCPGGWGASPQGDGMDACYNRHGNCMDLTPEIAELLFPVRCLRRELICDSGGAGLHRGGLGSRQTWQVCRTEDATVSQIMTQSRQGPAGALGGGPGRAGRAWLNYGQAGQRLLTGQEGQQPWRPSFLNNQPLAAGDTYTCETAGGGGWGNPLQRDPQQVLKDVRDGRVSPEAARRDYGVVLGQGGDAVDQEATWALRQQMQL